MFVLPVFFFSLIGIFFMHNKKHLCPKNFVFNVPFKWTILYVNLDIFMVVNLMGKEKGVNS